MNRHQSAKGSNMELEVSLLSSRWKELEEIHNSLGQTSIKSVSLEIWHQVILQTLTPAVANRSVMCHISPAVCHHCHQLSALSAITTMTLLTKERENTQVQKLYLYSLLLPDHLNYMMDLFVHPCPFLRYQVRRALTTLLMCHWILDNTVQYICHSCIRIVLQHPVNLVFCLEPLQLLCCMLSRYCGHSRRLQTLQCIAPQLANLYQHFWTVSGDSQLPMTEYGDVDKTSRLLTMFKEDCPQRHSAEFFSDQSGMAVSHHQELHFDSASSFHDVKLKAVINLSCMNEDEMKCQSIPDLDDYSTDRAKQKKLDQENCVYKGKAGNQHDLSENFSVCILESDLLESAQRTRSAISRTWFCNEQHCKPDDQLSVRNLDKTCRQPTQSDNVRYSDNVYKMHNQSENVKHLDNTYRLSGQLERLKYMFLCLLQKINKLVNSLELPERVRWLEYLSNNVLMQIVSEYTSLIGKDFTIIPQENLLVVRKFLDVLDTFLDYARLRTQDISDSAYEIMAAYFIHHFKASGCSWSFPSHCTLIGGDDYHSRNLSSVCFDGKGLIPDKGGLSHRFGDRQCNPLLVLLLSVVLKSSAIIFKTAARLTVTSGILASCTTVLLSMHIQLHQIFNEGLFPEKSVPVLPDHLNWLPQVCGEQDDRWMETLVCLLDIYISSQSQCTASDSLKSLIMLLNPHQLFNDCAGSDSLKSLIMLLNPHLLFIQLLQETHYDVSLLTDWLTSPETCFLAYFTRYLRLMASEMSTFLLSACSWESSGSYISSVTEESDEYSEELGVVIPQHGLVHSEEGQISDSLNLEEDAHLYSDPAHDFKTISHRCEENEPHCIQSVSGSLELEEMKSEMMDYMLEFKIKRNCLSAVGSVSGRKPSTGLDLLASYDDSSDVDDKVGDNGIDDSSEIIVKTGNNHIHLDTTVCGQNVQIERENVAHTVSGQGEPSSENAQLFPARNELKSSSSQKNDVVREKNCTLLSGNLAARVLNLLLNLRLKLEKLHKSGLMVYDPSPLVNLIRRCEENYEKINSI